MYVVPYGSPARGGYFKCVEVNYQCRATRSSRSSARAPDLCSARRSAGGRTSLCPPMDPRLTPLPLRALRTMPASETASGTTRPTRHRGSAESTGAAPGKSSAREAKGSSSSTPLAKVSTLALLGLRWVAAWGWAHAQRLCSALARQYTGATTAAGEGWVRGCQPTT